MAHRRELHLSEAQRAELEQGRDHDGRPYVRERCAALLKIADGQAAYAVARSGLLKARKAETLYRWIAWYEKGGYAGLVARSQGGVRRRCL